MARANEQEQVWLMIAVLDTNHFRELRENSTAGQRVQAQIEEKSARVFGCIVAAEESLQGRLAFIRSKRSGRDQVEGYRRLHATLDSLGRLTILLFDDDAASVFHELERLKVR